MKLKGKVAVVTGGAQGIGKSISLAFAREGSDVVIADLSFDKAKKVSENIQAMGRKALALELDVTRSDQVDQMVKAALDAFGKIDILANVAGIFIRSPIQEVSERDWDRVIDVNLKGTFLCSQSVGKQMIKQGCGSILNTASIAAHTPQINLGAYSSSKAGVLLLTKLMAVEWAPFHIRVNALSPGPTSTPMFNSIYNTESMKNTRKKAIPLNRFASPDEVAKSAVFLVSNDAGFITGHSMVVDGGSIESMYHLASLLTTSS